MGRRWSSGEKKIKEKKTLRRLQLHVRVSRASRCSCPPFCRCVVGCVGVWVCGCVPDVLVVVHTSERLNSVESAWKRKSTNSPRDGQKKTEKYLLFLFWKKHVSNKDEKKWQKRATVTSFPWLVPGMEENKKNKWNTMFLFSLSLSLSKETHSTRAVEAYGRTHRKKKGEKSVNSTSFSSTICGTRLKKKAPRTEMGKKNKRKRKSRYTETIFRCPVTRPHSGTNQREATKKWQTKKKNPKKNDAKPDARPVSGGNETRQSTKQTVDRPSQLAGNNEKKTNAHTHTNTQTVKILVTKKNTSRMTSKKRGPRNSSDTKEKKVVRCRRWTTRTRRIKRNEKKKKLEAHQGRP